MHQGEKIRQARLAKGMSQSDLAAALGVTKPAISRYELGQRHLSPDQLAAISKILDVPITELLDLEPGKKAELEQAMQILSGIQERDLEGQYLSEADQWIDSAVVFLKYLIDKEVAIAAASDGEDRQEPIEEPEPAQEPEPEPEPETPEQRKGKKRMNRLSRIFESLNDEGQRRVIELARDLSCIPAYRQEPITDDSQNHI